MPIMKSPTRISIPQHNRLNMLVRISFQFGAVRNMSTFETIKDRLRLSKPTLDQIKGGLFLIIRCLMIPDAKCNANI